jgi:hypothetical protein
VCFPLNDLESFTGIAWNENFSFTLDPARVNDQFAADSDGKLPRVIANSQISREKEISKTCDLGRESVHFGISSFYEMEHIAR